MKQMRSHPMSRWLARLLSLLMVAPYLVVGGAARPVSAQRRAHTVYILDFNNRAEIGGPLLGRQAAAQLAVELTDDPNWIILPDRMVQQQIRSLEIRPPFDRIARQQIARAVDADAVMYGTVRSASLSTDPMQASVTIQVVAEDVHTGTLFNGALVTGASVPRTGFAGEADILLEEALNKAGFKARQFMDRFRTPEGTVLNTAVVGETKMKVLLNVGARQGIKRDMEMVVTRQRDLVGMVKVQQVNANDSMAEVTLNIQGVRPEDRVRGIFRFEDIPDERKQERRVNAAASDSKSARVAAAERPRKPLALSLKPREGTFEPMVAAGPEPGAALLAQAGNVRKGGDPGPGSGKAGDTTTDAVGAEEVNTVVVDEPRTARRRSKPFISTPTAKILAGGALLFGILAIGGTKNETRAFAIEARTFQADGIGSPATGIRISWKKPRGVPGRAGSDQTFQDGILGYVLYRIDTTGGGIAEVVGGTLGDLRQFLDGFFVIHMVPNVFPGGQPGQDAGDPEDLEDVPGLIPGHRYRYQVQAAYHTEQDFDGDGAPDDLDLLAPLSPFSNAATVLVPAVILSPAPGDTVDLSNLTVTFQTTPGADKYQVAVSSGIGFRASKTARCPTVTVVPPDKGGPTEASAVGCDVSVKLLGAPQVFISVFAWTSSDARPVPFGAVTYPPIAVTPVTPPPPPTPRPEKRGGPRGR